jgi:hypothetical protein
LTKDQVLYDAEIALTLLQPAQRRPMKAMSLARLISEGNENQLRRYTDAAAVFGAHSPLKLCGMTA